MSRRGSCGSTSRTDAVAWMVGVGSLLDISGTATMRSTVALCQSASHERSVRMEDPDPEWTEVGADGAASCAGTVQSADWEQASQHANRERAVHRVLATVNWAQRLAFASVLTATAGAVALAFSGHPAVGSALGITAVILVATHFVAGHALTSRHLNRSGRRPDDR